MPEVQANPASSSVTKSSAENTAPARPVSDTSASKPAKKRATKTKAVFYVVIGLAVAAAGIFFWANQSSSSVEALPCLLSIEVPVPDFTVADLVSLEPGRLINTRWTVGEDVPLRVNGGLIAWSEFEIVSNHIAVRLTELA